MKFPSWLIPLSVVAIATTTTIVLQRQTIDRQLRAQTPESDRLWVERERRKLQALQKLPPSGFGFNNLIADYVFIAFLQYYGDDVARVDHKTGYGLSKEYFQIIVNRKPYFFNSHAYLASSVGIYSGEPQVSISLMEQALELLSPERFNLTFSLWRRKAVDELLFLGDGKKAQQSFQKAKESVERATFAPELETEVKLLIDSLEQTVNFLQEDFNSIRAKRMGWFLILNNAPDLRTKQIAVAELQKIGVPIEISPEGEVKLNSPN